MNKKTTQEILDKAKEETTIIKNIYFNNYAKTIAARITRNFKKIINKTYLGKYHRIPSDKKTVLKEFYFSCLIWPKIEIYSSAKNNHIGMFINYNPNYDYTILTTSEEERQLLKGTESLLEQYCKEIQFDQLSASIFDSKLTIENKITK